MYPSGTAGTAYGIATSCSVDAEALATIYPGQLSDLCS
ncbi:MAG: hypothetical protein QOH84_3735 [Kribbellaceae bacterium]|nr:hypothetical protein [Kribbellaceae bacterium]